MVEVSEVPATTEADVPIMEVPTVIEVVPLVEVPAVEPVVEVPAVEPVVEVPVVQKTTVEVPVIEETTVEVPHIATEVAVVKALPAKVFVDESPPVFTRTKTSFELVFEKLCDSRVLLCLGAGASIFWAVKSLRSRK